MNNESARELLRAAVVEVELSPAPVDDLVRRGASSRRRTRRWQLAAVAAAVIGVVGASLAVAGGPGDEAGPAPANSDAVVEAPDGARYVGMGRLVVAVPQDWGYHDLRCGVVPDGTIAFSADPERGCLHSFLSSRNALHVASADSEGGARWLDVPGTPVEIDGITLTRTAVAARTDDSSTYSGALVATSEGVVIWAQSDDPEVVTGILDSVRVLPQDMVAVPFDQDGPVSSPRQLIEAAGLNVEVVEEYRPGWSPGWLISSDPPLGSPVAIGSTVTLTVSGPAPQGADGQVSAADRRLVDLLATFAGDLSDEAVERLPFADEVGLGLASKVVTTIPANHVTPAKADLSDPVAWNLDPLVETFRGRDQGFDVLPYLRSDPDTWVLSVGPHPSCAAPVVPPSDELADFRQLSIQPRPGTFSSWLDWWSVDLFLDEAGHVHAVTLDLYEP
jgi:hypothetical protein